MAADSAERLPPTDTVRTVRLADWEMSCCMVAFDEAPRSKVALDWFSTSVSLAITTPPRRSSAMAMLACGESEIAAVRFVVSEFSSCP